VEMDFTNPKSKKLKFSEEELKALFENLPSLHRRRLRKFTK
jgi:hypothetical protein